MVYGPGPATEGNLVARLLHDHLHHRLPGIVGADRQWSFAWIDDVAEAHVSALDRGRPGAEYIVGGENAPQMRLFEIARDVTGRRLPRRLPAGLIRLAGALDEARAWVAGPPPLVTRGAVDIFREDWPLDSGKRCGSRIRCPERWNPECGQSWGRWACKDSRRDDLRSRTVRLVTKSCFGLCYVMISSAQDAHPT